MFIAKFEQIQHDTLECFSLTLDLFSLSGIPKPSILIKNIRQIKDNPAGIYLLKVNDRNTGTRCEICSKLTIKTPERRQWRRCGVFIVNFEPISRLVLVFLLLTLNM